MDKNNPISKAQAFIYLCLRLVYFWINFTSLSFSLPFSFSSSWFSSLLIAFQPLSSFSYIPITPSFIIILQNDHNKEFIMKIIKSLYKLASAHLRISIPSPSLRAIFWLAFTSTCLVIVKSTVSARFVACIDQFTTEFWY